MDSAIKTPEDAVRKGVTMKDVASHAGVHHSSVSVVLNGSRSSTGISAATRQRILDAAEELGYRRNVSAHITRTGRFGSVALLLSPKRSSSYLPPPLLAGLYDALNGVDMTLTVCMLPDEELTDRGVLPKILRERMCDGLLIDYNQRFPRPMIETIQRHQIPSVWINSQQPGDCIYPDDFDAGYQATQTLLKLGHTRITYVDFIPVRSDDPTQHYSRRERRDGYLAAMREAGLQAQVWDTDRFGFEADSHIGFCEELLKQSPRPTAFVGYAVWAMEGISYALHRLHLKVPDDVSVVSFGPEQIDYMSQSLTMLIEPQYQLALQATQMILQKIESPTAPLAPVAVPFTLLEGATATAHPDFVSPSRAKDVSRTSQLGEDPTYRDGKRLQEVPLVREMSPLMEAFSPGAVTVDQRHEGETLSSQSSSPD